MPYLVTSWEALAYYKVVTYSYHSRGAAMIKMTDLPVNAKGRICCIEAEGMIRRRLMDLGFVPGTEVETVRRRPGGSPAIYLLRGTMIALRKGQSDHIYVERSGCS